MSLSEAGTLTLWTQGQTNTTLSYHGTDENGNRTFANISYLGVDENDGAIPLSQAESGVRWAGDENGILSIHISNASLDHYFIVRIATAGFYELFLNFLVAGAADEDSDGFSDGADNCPALRNPAQRDTDGDERGNVCDSDDDNDNVADEEEAAGCALLADCDNDTISDALDNCVLIAGTNLTDTDMDGMGNICDADDDNDTVPDNDEAAGCALLADCDSDTISDALDNCPAAPNANQQDMDRDGIGDACDPTQDNDADGVVDGEDNCPEQANALQEDFDEDMIGDICDDDGDNDDVPDEEEAATRCILDADCDDDGTNDAADVFPLDATESADFDGDTIGDNADSDDDDDNVPDTEEAETRCILDPDCDDDGTNDDTDAFPLDATESADFDGDRIGDNADSDDDDDNVPDTEEAETRCILDPDCDDDGTNDDDDAFPLDATESADFDGDTIGDNADSDDDDDNVPDTEEAETRCILDPDCDDDGTNDDTDAFPLDATESADFDSDTIGDNADIDEDGDGLIEIWSADMLHNVRYVLNGTSYKESATAPINQLGCGNQADDECIGYELTADISLADYADYEGGKGWLPIGNDTNPNTDDDCGTQGFNATFEGNDRTIRNLTIARGDEECIGLFGFMAPAARIRNLHIRADSIHGKNRVGALVGFGQSAIITNSSTISHTVKGSDQIGGLIGDGSHSTITNSSAISHTVKGSDQIGGLIGDGSHSTITNSSAISHTVKGYQEVGGLIGDGGFAEITSSYARSYSIKNGNSVGGLVGWARGATIIKSYALSYDMTKGNSAIGGLVGNGDWDSPHESTRMRIMSSYAVTSLLLPNIAGLEIAGLVGAGKGSRITNSYAVAETLDGLIHISGFIGNGVDAAITSSYSLSGVITAGSTVGGLVALVNSDTDIRDSYWDNDTSSFPGGAGTAQTSDSLRSPISATGIYANWGDDGDCGWDFGTSSDYPALLCLPDSTPEQQRALYSVSQEHNVTVHLREEDFLGE